MAIPLGKIHEIQFSSIELKEDIPLFVYIPASFSPLTTYSILITQDAKDYFQLGRLARFSDDLLFHGEIEDLIIVGTHYRNIEDRRQKYHPLGEENGAFIRFLAHELVPWIDEKFPTTGMGLSRTLMGDSLAGTVSLMTALKYPHIFGKLILHSPYVDQHVLDAVKNHHDPSLLEIYHVIGKDESVVKISNNRDFLTPNRQLKQLFTEKDIPHFYDEFDGGHSWKFWQPDVKRALKKMFSKL